ncbi:aspartate/glutamate racemase family protein [Breznakiella homolactica]|uniref:Hydantoin racemase n=1 Tax=Breznakiella homolactica TaxID=2798577 RepID=A0A7T7XME9_9SPIR|nr:aspartate/glutamate racemase family protein [Breznakiella homolactica]QQO08902.1 aspartate/glutamate racemase family protein [Breznakiella homolactica]
MKIGLIRVITLDDPEQTGLHGRILEERFPGLEVFSRCIPGQPRGVFDKKTEQEAAPKIAELGQRMAETGGAEAIIISCASDPGLAELRGAVGIPVIGAGTAVAALALVLSDRVATMGITGQTPDRMREILGPRLVGEVRPGGVSTTLDLLTEQGKNASREACKKLAKESGAGVIALSCTGYATIGFAAELAQAAGIPVLDPLIAAGYAVLYTGTSD